MYNSVHPTGILSICKKTIYYKGQKNMKKIFSFRLVWDNFRVVHTFLNLEIRYNFYRGYGYDSLCITDIVWYYNISNYSCEYIWKTEWNINGQLNLKFAQRRDFVEQKKEKCARPNDIVIMFFVKLRT